MATRIGRRAPLLVVLLFVLVAAATFSTAPAHGQSSPIGSDGELVEEGAELFIASCASCHGADGGGTEVGPSLEDAGAAAADFQLTTGRMPLADPDAQSLRKEPAFDAEEIDALVAYVASLGEGPPIPEVELTDGLSSGQELFVANCAACHGATGNGGAAGRNVLAPSLYSATPLQLAEAMITGPGEMPIFGFSEDERNDIVSFVTYLQTETAPGGADIGGIGPVPEGFVGWAVGTGALVGVCYLLGRKKKPSAGGAP